METTTSFGYWIRRQRKARDLSQQTLAEQVGCSLAAIKKIEQDERRPSRQIAGLLADVLGVPASQREIFQEVARGVRPVEQLARAQELTPSTATRLEKSFPTNLPIQLTSFIGREKEIADVIRLLEKTRLVTLTGPGGTGKTRLSIQVANELLDQYPDGVWLVELAPILDPILVPRAAAIAMGLRDEPHRPVIEMLCDYLRVKKMLIILDNCEHLIEACAQMADTLLHACPQIHILATSREALGIAGETLYLVPSLTRPDLRNLPALESLKQYEAIQLFMDRATSAISTFALTEENASSIARICKRLDGIPLAIELAASKIRALSASQIAERLDDRFHLLTGGSRTALPRYQTLQATIDWSYNLLSPAEQILFRRLSVFVGGWTLEAAESVCPDKDTMHRGTVKTEDILELLTRLVNKSLVMTEERNGEVRYRLLETIRQYARNKLFESGEREYIQDRHFDFFLTFAEEAEPKLHGSEQLTWFNYLETEHDNFRSALDWAKTGGYIQEGLRLVSALRLFWFVRGYWSEGYRWLLEMLIQPEAGKRTLPRAQALAAAASFAIFQGDSTIGQNLVTESITLCRELGEQGKHILAFALGTLGWSLMWQDPTSASALLEESLVIARQIGYQYVIATSLNALGNILKEHGDYEAARKRFEESVATCREAGDRRFSSPVLSNLGFVLYKEGDSITARSKLDQALVIAREMRDERHIAGLLNYLGDIELNEGHYQQAQSFYVESLELWQKMGGKDGIAESLECFAALAVVQDKDFTVNSRAVQLLGAAESLRQSFDIQRELSLRTPHDHLIATERARLGKRMFETAWVQGQAMTMEQAIEYALRLENESEDLQFPKM